MHVNKKYSWFLAGIPENLLNTFLKYPEEDKGQEVRVWRKYQLDF